MKFYDGFINSSTCIILFFFIIVGNYLGPILGCGLNKALNKQWARQVLSLMLIFFSSVLITDEFAESNIGEQIGFTFLFYIWFILISKSYYIFALLSIVLLLAAYYMKRQTHTKKKSIFITEMVALGLSVIGSIIYMGKKKYQYKNKFSYLTFFMGKEECSNYSYDGHFKEYLHALFKY